MRGLRALSIRARITLGSLLIAAVLFSIAATFFRLEVQSILDQTTATLLENDTAPVAAELGNDPTWAPDPPGEGQLIAVVDPNGTVRVSSLPRSLIKRISSLVTLGDEPELVDTGRNAYRVVAERVRTPEGTWIVVAARNQEALTLLLDELTRVLMIGAAVLLVGFGIASWLLTGAALRPVNRLRAEAESLSSNGSSARLAVPPGRDEVSRLAVTLNTFIGQLRRGIDREKQVVSDASHELRTPLAVLKAQLDLAHLDSGDAAALERDIDEASATVDRLTRLATNLLELSKLESEQTRPETSWTDLTSEITASVDRARAVQDSRGLEVAYDTDCADPTGRYLISRTNLGQLLDNLISNAVTAMDGHGTVTVTVRQDDSAALLTVADTGPGMPDEFIPLAFDRFSRPDPSRGGTSGGAGLGLAIVRAIVDRAHGSIELRNTDPGLSVLVKLPRTTPGSL